MSKLRKIAILSTFISWFVHFYLWFEVINTIIDPLLSYNGAGGVLISFGIFSFIILVCVTFSVLS
jgi:hypothetical protein